MKRFEKYILEVNLDHISLEPVMSVDFIDMIVLNMKKSQIVLFWKSA